MNRGRTKYIGMLMTLIMALLPLQLFAMNPAGTANESNCMETMISSTGEAMYDEGLVCHDHSGCGDTCVQGACCGYSVPALTHYVSSIERSVQSQFAGEVPGYRSVVPEHDLPPPRFT